MDSSDTREEIEESLAHILRLDQLPQYIDDAVFLEVGGLLSKLPEKSTWWAENPRTYTLLRILGYHEDTAVFQWFETEKTIGDIWLPLGTPTLKQLSSSLGISPPEWRGAQFHILSKPELMKEDKLLSHVSHRHIRNGTSHFQELIPLGEGRSAQVSRVQHMLSGREYACKRIHREKDVKVQHEQLHEFQQEIRILKRIRHHHTVHLVASFTDLTSFSLILNPVAEDVLLTMLKRQSDVSPLSDSDLSILRRSFGCLATALAYLHESKVRHKDIKPGNILLSNGSVVLCDFGISRDWSKSEHATTEGEPMRYTRRYIAPEVYGKEPRNDSSDIWSLGCVYLEILSVVKGHSVETINRFFYEKGEGLVGEGFWQARQAMLAWLAVLRSKKNDSADDKVIDWITRMTREAPEDRPKASELVNMIKDVSMGSGLFIHSCCARPDSVLPVDPTYSPTLPLRGLVLDLGNRENSVSQPTNQMLMPPYRNGSDSSNSINRHMVPPSQDTNSRDRSISPHTESPHFRGSEDTVPTTIGSVDFRPETSSPGLPQRDSGRSISLTSDFFHTTDLVSSPRPETRPRSPVQPPANDRLYCTCQARPTEKHIFNEVYSKESPVEFDSDIPTIKTCHNCELGWNKVQVYESLPRDPSAHIPSIPMVWWVTRRLVVSYLSGDPETRRCSSFWVPLADIGITLNGTTVTLRWSDCNQMKERSSGNYGQHYDWIYEPKYPNNTLVIPFDATKDAEKFIGVMRLPFYDGRSLIYTYRANLTDGSDVSVFDVGRPGIRNYRAAVRTVGSTSKLFIIWPGMDLIIQNHLVNQMHSQYEMVVEMHKVSTPTYHSNVRGEPSADYHKAAQFETARLLKSTMIVKFPFRANATHQFSKPPGAVIDTLEALTGWSLSYFAIVSKFKSKNKRLGSKKYGRSDVMLWEKEVYDPVTRLRRHAAAAVTFRMHEDADPLWVSGMITHATTIETSSGSDATVSVAHKKRGKLLDTGKMTAVGEENLGGRSQDVRHMRGSSYGGGFDGDGGSNFLTDLVLTFENSLFRRDFVNLVEQYKINAATSPPLALILSHTDTVRRMDSLASSTEGHGPPMR